MLVTGPLGVTGNTTLTGDVTVVGGRLLAANPQVGTINILPNTASATANVANLVTTSLIVCSPATVAGLAVGTTFSAACAAVGVLTVSCFPVLPGGVTVPVTYYVVQY